MGQTPTILHFSQDLQLVVSRLQLPINVVAIQLEMVT
jgi:hypothetical protein